MLALSTLVQIETVTSNQQRHKNEAQANALLAAQIAFGRLHKNLGNDQRITDNAYIIHSGYYTSLVVVGDKGVLITDPTNSYRAVKLQKSISQITNLPVTHILLSYEHYDNVGGTEVYKDAKIVAQRKAVPVFQLDVTGEVPKIVHETFDDAYSVTIGQTKAEFLHFCFPSDGVANAIAHLPLERMVYSADLYENRELQDKQFIDALNSLGVRESLNRLVTLKPKYAIASQSTGIEAKSLILADEFSTICMRLYYPNQWKPERKAMLRKQNLRKSFRGK